MIDIFDYQFRSNLPVFPSHIPESPTNFSFVRMRNLLSDIYNVKCEQNTKIHVSRLQEREEREEIEKELRAQSETLNLIRPLSSDEGSNGAGSGKDEAHKVVENTNNNTDSLLRRSPSSSAASSIKEPPPLGLAGLEAFRREYLTSPLSHLRAAAAANPRYV